MAVMSAVLAENVFFSRMRTSSVIFFRVIINTILKKYRIVYFTNVEICLHSPQSSKTKNYFPKICSLPFSFSLIHNTHHTISEVHFFISHGVLSFMGRQKFILKNMRRQRPKFLQQPMSNCYNGYMVNNNNTSKENNCIEIMVLSRPSNSNCQSFFLFRRS